MRFNSVKSTVCAHNESVHRMNETNGRTLIIVVRYGQEVTSIREIEKSPNAGLEKESSQLNEPTWVTAARAAQSKKGLNLVVLDLREITSFADYFLICTGTNSRQNQAISDEIYHKLKDRGEIPVSLEGYDNAEWILQDYGDLICHVFLDRTRTYYDLERLWRHAKRVEIPAEAA
jgi:ribosome-associated protein